MFHSELITITSVGTDVLTLVMPMIYLIPCTVTFIVIGCGTRIQVGYILHLFMYFFNPVL